MVTKVLLVEDDQEQALLFTRVLEMSGYTVVLVPDAVEAQVRLAAEPFTLLLADWNMAGKMQGDALIHWAKAHYPDIKSILYSNHPQVDEIAKSCGANNAFRKIEGIVKLRQLVMGLAPLEKSEA